jgi:hypothetical protein
MLSRTPRVLVSANSACTRWRTRIDSEVMFPSGLSPPLEELRRAISRGA